MHLDNVKSKKQICGKSLLTLVSQERVQIPAKFCTLLQVEKLPLAAQDCNHNLLQMLTVLQNQDSKTLYKGEKRNGIFFTSEILDSGGISHKQLGQGHVC